MQTLEETVLKPIMWAVAALMVGFHKVLSVIGLPEDSGLTWGLSIVGLVLVIRVLLIPLFVKQIHASRRMQLIQPEMQKIQKRYKGKTDPDSRKAMSAETMELYKRTGTNPFSSCLPILLQSPIFFALFRVLNDLSKIANNTHSPIGPMSKHLASSAESSTVFGASLSSTFLGSPDDLNVRVVTILLIIGMSASMFTTQRQLMRKNMPASALDNPAAKMQKYMLYVLPLFFLVSGINFPVGVLLYWLTTNVWSMGQQFYVIRRMPAPGSLAERNLEERRMRQGKEHKRFTVPGLQKDDDEAAAEEADTEAQPASGQRVQPKRKSRQRPTGAGGSDDSPTVVTAEDGTGPSEGSGGSSGTKPVVARTTASAASQTSAARKTAPAKPGGSKSGGKKKGKKKKGASSGRR